MRKLPFSPETQHYIPALLFKSRMSSTGLRPVLGFPVFWAMLDHAF